MLAKHRLDLGMNAWDQKQVDALFLRHDRNRDANITVEEVGASGMAALKTHDLNSDNMISTREVEKFYADNRKKLGFSKDDYQKAKAMLLRHDTNRSKFIEVGELFESPTSGQLSKGIFDRADQDDDQRIELNELARYFASQGE